MTKRYDNRRVFTNRDDLYTSALESRDRKSIRHYNTPKFSYPDELDLDSITKLDHIWTVGDRFYKLAHQYYGSSRYWWVIAYFNQTPTEADLSLGQVIFIPLPLERVLRAYESQD